MYPVFTVHARQDDVMGVALRMLGDRHEAIEKDGIPAEGTPSWS
jgi:hypothetical protein